MADQKHTPGPWLSHYFASDEYAPLADEGSFVVCPQRDRVAQPLALMWHGDDGDGDRVSESEAKANARLMSAAPELFQLVLEFVAEAEDAGLILPSDLARLERARAAIIKVNQERR